MTVAWQPPLPCDRTYRLDCRRRCLWEAKRWREAVEEATKDDDREVRHVANQSPGPECKYHVFKEGPVTFRVVVPEELRERFFLKSRGD